MQYIHSGEFFTAGEVKPLDRLLVYRERCLALTREALEHGAEPRTRCPACRSEIEPVPLPHQVPYGCCRSCSSLVIASVPSAERWAAVSEEAARLLYVPSGPDDATARRRREHLYLPKANWIGDSLKMFGWPGGTGLVLVPIQEAFVQALAERVPELPTRGVDALSLERAFRRVRSEAVPQQAPLMAEALECPVAGAAILLEGLDRARDPVRLLEAAAAALSQGGLLFLTALMASGFELRVLGAQCRYLFPPDKAHCLSLTAIERLLSAAGFELLESSTPGVLDCDSVLQHLKSGMDIPLSPFEEAVLAADEEVRRAFQGFLQLARLSSFGRFVARRRAAT